jgi:hypothetical protein
MCSTWRSPPSPFPQGGGESGRGEGTREVALFADTFNTYFEPENLRDAVEVLSGLGYRVVPLAAAEGGRPLCCGRTFLSAGLVEEARAEARRLLAEARPFVERGVPIVGLEPSCLFTLRDEPPAMLPGEEAGACGQALLIEELLAPRLAGRITAHRAPRRAVVLPATATRRRSVPCGHRGTGARRGPRSRRWIELLHGGLRPRADTTGLLAMGELFCAGGAPAPVEATIGRRLLRRHQIHDAPAAPCCTSRASWPAMDEPLQRSAPNY